MKKIILFYPRGFDVTTSGSRTARFAACLAPMGLASLAAVLRKNGHNVSLWDANRAWQIPNEEWARRLATASPDIVGFSAITAHFHDAYDVCRRLKDLTPQTVTVFGGAHFSWGKGDLLSQFPAIDYGIAGEGELALSALAANEPAATIEGLWYRDGSSVQSGPPRTSMITMDDLPFPAYDLVESFPRGYAPALFSYPRFPAASIISSRGCVYQCSYCDRSVFGKSFRWNSPEYTAELVAYLHRDFGVRHVMFYDDLFTLNRNRVSRLCTLLKAQKPTVTFNYIVRVGHIPDDLIAELRAAGCWMVHVGIESGDQSILDSHKEGVTLEGIRRDVGRLHAAGIWVKGLFMMGFPGETAASIQKTIEFACSLPLKDANITTFTPFPGAPISAGIHAAGHVDDDWSKMDCVNPVFISHEIGSRVALETLYKEFIRRFYSRPFARKVYHRMLWQSPHSYWRLLKNAPSFLGYRRKIIT